MPEQRRLDWEACDYDDPTIFGHHSRWLINKEWDGTGWLLHEPIGCDSLGATRLPTFDAAVRLFIAYTEAPQAVHRA